MAKFILFGSTNRTALHFIRHASASNLKILCLYPYETQDFDRYSLLISSLGGIPIRYNFRGTNPELEGHHGEEALKSILDGGQGVIWAADPDLRQTTLSSRTEERFSDSIADLKSTLSVMRELDSPRRFLLLTRHTNHGLVRVLKDNEKWWRTHTTLNRTLYNAGLELLEPTKNTEGLKWTILRVGRYLRGAPPMQLNERGIDLGAKESDGVWRDDIARAMVEVLKVEGLSSMFLDIKSVPGTQDNNIENVIRNLAIPRNSKLIGDSLLRTTTDPPISFSSADPILSTLNPRNFPHQFAQISKKDQNLSRMNQILETVRQGRTENTKRLQEEAKRNDELCYAREKARSEALMQGLPPPGADITMLRRVQTCRNRRRVTPTKETSINHIRKTLLSRIHEMNRSNIDKIIPRTDNKQSTIVESQAEEQSTMPEVCGDHHASMESNSIGKTVFEKLASVLLDRSADYFSPHLAGPVVETDDSEEGYHPRWKYTRFKVKRPRNRRW